MAFEREEYLKGIVNNLAIFQQAIKFRTGLNLQDLGIIAEDFIKELLNIVADFQLENLNSTVFNQASIDLGDSINKVAVQVTATTTRDKIKYTIDKFIALDLHKQYSRLIVFTLKDRKPRYQKFDTLGHFDFDETKDIIDFKSLLSQMISHLSTDKLQQVHNFIAREIAGVDRQDRKIQQLSYAGYIPDKVKLWQYQPLTLHYANIHRLIYVAASSGLRLSYVPTAKLDQYGSIRALPLDDYIEIAMFVKGILEYWHPTVLNLQNFDNLTKDFIGCTFEFFQTDFKSKNIKFWNQGSPSPKMHGILKKDPYLYTEVQNIKIYLPLNLAWMMTDTSYHNFGIDSRGLAECLSGLCILKSITSEQEAIFTPLFIGIYDVLQQVRDAVARGENEIQIRQSW